MVVVIQPSPPLNLWWCRCPLLVEAAPFVLNSMQSNSCAGLPGLGRYQPSNPSVGVSTGEGPPEGSCDLWSGPSCDGFDPIRPTEARGLVELVPLRSCGRIPVSATILGRPWEASASRGAGRTAEQPSWSNLHKDVGVEAGRHERTEAAGQDILDAPQRRSRARSAEGRPPLADAAITARDPQRRSAPKHGPAEARPNVSLAGLLMSI